MSAKDFAPLASNPVQPTPTSYIPPVPTTPPTTFPDPIVQRPSWTPETSPSAFAPTSTQSPPATPDRRVQSLRFLNRASRVSIDALNWAERKTREAADRQLERQMARHEASGTPVHRLVEDPREPRYLADRRNVRFAEVKPEYYGYASGGLKA